MAEPTFCELMVYEFTVMIHVIRKATTEEEEHVNHRIRGKLPPPLLDFRAVVWVLLQGMSSSTILDKSSWEGCTTQ